MQAAHFSEEEGWNWQMSGPCLKGVRGYIGIILG